MRLLIVEDNSIIQIIYQMLMNQWGYSFDMVSDGLEAVELVQKIAANTTCV